MAVDMLEWLKHRIPKVDATAEIALTPREELLLETLAQKISTGLPGIGLKLSKNAVLQTPAAGLELRIFGEPLVLLMPSECALELSAFTEKLETPLVLGTFDTAQQLTFLIGALKILRELKPVFNQRIFFKSLSLIIFPEDARKNREDFYPLNFYLRISGSAYACRALLSPALKARLSESSRRLLMPGDRQRVISNLKVDSKFFCSTASSSLWMFSELKVGKKIPLSLATLRKARLEAGGLELPLEISKLAPGEVGAQVSRKRSKND